MCCELEDGGYVVEHQRTGEVRASLELQLPHTEAPSIAVRTLPSASIAFLRLPLASIAFHWREHAGEHVAPAGAQLKRADGRQPASLKVVIDSGGLSAECRGDRSHARRLDTEEAESFACVKVRDRARVRVRVRARVRVRVRARRKGEGKGKGKGTGKSTGKLRAKERVRVRVRDT